MAKTNLCSIEECGKPTICRGYCSAHYQRLRIYGDPLFTKIRVGKNHCQKKECPAVIKIRSVIYYLNNAERKKIIDKAYRSSESGSAVRKAHRSREDVRAEATATKRKWRAANPERHRKAQLDFYANNKEIVCIYAAKRRARKKKAMPSWLTEDQIQQIKEVYAEAKRLEEKTGIPHHVDHIVPLVGRIVCGLHVPWNLRAIPKADNLSRPRIYRMGMD